MLTKEQLLLIRTSMTGKGVAVPVELIALYLETLQEVNAQIAALEALPSAPAS
jgi:hypothetical protein